MIDAQAPSTRPYLIRAIHEWCTDHGFTPYLAVRVDERVQVPMEHVRDNEIVLNVSYDATSGLQMGNEWIEFKARFGGVPRDLFVPVDHVMAIYARENGQGMAFPLDLPDDGAVPQPSETGTDDAGEGASKVVKLVSIETPNEVDPAPEPPTPPQKPGPRPSLKLVK